MNNKSLGAIFCCLLIISLTPAAAYGYSLNNTTNSAKSDLSHLNSSENTTNVTKNSSYLNLTKPHNSLFEIIDTITLYIYQFYNIRITLKYLPKSATKESLNKLIGNYKIQNSDISKENVILVSKKNDKIEFYHLIDGDADEGYYVLHNHVKGNILVDDLKDMNYANIMLVVENRNVDMDKVLGYLTNMTNNYDELFNPQKKPVYNVTGTANTTVKLPSNVVNDVYALGEWLCINLLKFSRLKPAFVGWNGLQKGMMPICITNSSDYSSITPTLIQDKNPKNISLISPNDKDTMVINKDTFCNKLYTGIALINMDNSTNWDSSTAVIENKPLNNLQIGTQLEVVRYAGYLLDELFKQDLTSLNPKDNAFINAVWISWDLYKQFGYKTTVKRLSLSEVRQEIAGQNVVFLLIKEKNGHWVYLPVVRAFDGSFELSVGDHTEIWPDWKLSEGYSGMSLVLNGNQDFNGILSGANMLLENFDPIKKDEEPSYREIIGEWTKENWGKIMGTGFSVLGTALGVGALFATLQYMAATTAIAAAGAGTAGAAAATVTTAALVTTAFIAAGVTIIAIGVVVGVVWGCFYLYDAWQAHSKWSDLKEKYKAKAI